MEIALKRYEQDLAEKRTRRKNDLDNLERGVEREKERVAKEKEAVTNLKKIQMQSLDDQVEQKKEQAVHDQKKNMRKTDTTFGPQAPPPNQMREIKQKKLSMQKKELDRQIFQREIEKHQQKTQKKYEDQLYRQGLEKAIAQEQQL